MKMCERVLDRNSGITDVIFWDLDRFTRRNRHFHEYSEDMVEAGITLHLASEGEEYNQNTAISWLQRIQSAEIESRKISKRTKLGQGQVTKKGRNIGPPPWGFTICHPPGEEESAGYLVPDLDLWPHVQRLWRMALEGYTPQQIAYIFDQEKIPPPGSAGWTDDAVRYILKNEKYKGDQFRGKERQSRLPGPKDDSPPIFYVGAHDGAVNQEEFDKVQDMIAGRHRGQGPTRSHSSKNPMSKILKCGECGEEHGYPTMVMSPKDGIARLRCARKKKVTAKSCHNDDVRLDSVLNSTLRYLREEFITAANLANVIGIIQEKSGKYLHEMDSRKSNIAANLKSVRKEIENLNITIRRADDAQDIREVPMSLVRNLLELEQKERELEEEIGRINEGSDEARLFMEDPEGIMEAALDERTYTESKEGPAVRRFIQMFVERAELFRWQDGKRALKLTLSLRARSAESVKAPGTKIIVFDKKGESVPSESCLFGGNMGLRWG